MLKFLEEAFSVVFRLRHGPGWVGFWGTSTQPARVWADQNSGPTVVPRLAEATPYIDVTGSGCLKALQLSVSCPR
jgi:hypothetical protein